MTGERIPEPSGPGAVVIDIGGELGAVVAVTPTSLAGDEIEIRPVAEEWAGRHVAVRERTMPDGPMYAAIFPSLIQGDYELRIRHRPDSVVVALRVDGARVTTVHWPEG